MPGPVLHVGATVLCGHGGQAQPTAPNPRVTVSGQPIVTLQTPYVVCGCPNPAAAGGPCVTAQWVSGATRVQANGVPVLVQGGQAICAPTPVPLTVVACQVRVSAQ